jgi:phosphoribosylformylglycinamidine synthase
VLDAIAAGHVRAAHDISEGGVAAAAAEMTFGSGLGLRLELEERPDGQRPDEFLLSETGGFLLEVPEDEEEPVLALCARRGATARRIGRVVDERTFRVEAGDREILRLDLERLEPRWASALREALR